MVECPIETGVIFHLPTDAFQPARVGGIDNDVVMIVTATEEMFALRSDPDRIEPHHIFVKCRRLFDICRIECDIAELLISEIRCHRPSPFHV